MALLARLSAGWRSYLVHSHALRVARCQNLALLRESRKNFSAEVSEDEECQLHITDACVERIRRLKENAEGGNMLLRIRVDSGGCSGFQYSFTLDDVSEEGDRTFSKEDVQIVVDEVSMQFLKGATVDYTEELIKSAFEVTSNPNAESSCGCGNSFVPT
eukprot:CAMPEP_0197477182 /NCGR_PEP_ID=MMETSP1309-20131121/14563_1 /TAXON_ID=464262 /ORGANISM="Genus nov. species nov., Strain RCC998" /LENGTH=158 /DNA_ID=CAMNT_0043017993 /DNA_START=66 /DNA_END=542 /DNA_ORIENTATION=+